ncbi:hypothetical protein D3C74_148220 [compost metagenome]
MSYRKNSKKNNRRGNNTIDSLSFSDRVSRLVLMTAILGGLSLVYIKALGTILSTLTTKIYLQSFFNFEHVLSSGMLSTGVLILGYAVWYCYCELLTLNHIYKSNNESKKILQLADKSYALLFRLIRLYVTSSILITIISIIVIGFIVKNYIIIGLFFFVFFIFLVMIIFPKSRKLISHKKIFDFVKTNRVALFIWLIVTFLMFCTIFIAMETHQKSMFKIDFVSSSNTLPIKFHFKNSVPDKISVSFYSIDKNNNSNLTKQIIINGSDFSRSFVEVTEKPISSSTFSWLNIIDKEVKKSQDTALVANLSKYDYKYDLNSLMYLKEGRNFVKIEFNSNSGFNDKFYKIVNQIDIDKYGVKITTKAFE